MVKQKFVAKLVNLDPILAEQLRQLAFVNRCSQMSIIKKALLFYFKHPEGVK